MFGNKKERNFVIMDGSNRRFVKEIISIVEMETGNMHWFNKLKRNIKCRALDRNHPTMKVVTIKGYYQDFDELRRVLTRDYPAQCIFDAPL